MNKIHQLLIILCCSFLYACTPSAEEQQRITRAERYRLYREDSLALKIAVMPTMDCLPIYVAKERHMYDTADIRLRLFSSQMDCDTAVSGGGVEGTVTDLVRATRMKNKGIQLTYYTETNAYWLLVANHKARIHEIDQLGDKMIAMTKGSATNLLTERALQGVKTKAEVFRIPINDVNIRLSMLLNNEMDAAWLTEPQASLAKAAGHPVLYDSRDTHTSLGVIAFRTKNMSDKHRQSQLAAFRKGYNQACDSINVRGVRHYADVLKKYYGLTDKQIRSVPHLKYGHAASPKSSDISTAESWQ